MSNRKMYLPGALVLSGASTVLGMLPYIFIWLLIRELFNAPNATSRGLVGIYAWWAFGTALGGIATYFLALTLSHLAAFRVETNMRREAMRKIMKLPLGFFDGNTSGRIRKIIDDNASITHTFLAHQMPDLAGSIMMPIVAMVLVFAVDWRLGLACLVPIIFAMGLMSFMMGTKGRQFMRNYMSSLEDMNTEAVEYVRGIPVVKVFQQTVFSFKNFHDSIMRYKNMVYQYTLMWEKPMSAYTAVIHGFVYLLVPVAIILTGHETHTVNVLFNLILYILITPVFGQSIMKSMYMNQALGQATEAINRMESLTDVEPLAVSAAPKPLTGHDIRFSGVSFSYPGTEKKAVDNISFTLPEGKTYALVGPSGGGKTTIARLVPRFWDVDSGRVTIGETDVRDISTEDLMDTISFVFQNTRLFKTSIEENIRYGNAQASREAVENAIDAARCRDIIGNLPDGLKTTIGIDGTYLSGGEQQRIALARAILKDAPIVVLDEATAFADPENEDLIQQALRNLTRDKTVLMIAHRLTSVVEVDSILVINEGRIVEQGTHRELLDSDGVYAGMWEEYQKSISWTIGREMTL